MNLYDADRFTFSLPLWTLAVTKKLADRALAEATLRLHLPDGVNFGGLFTDEDLAFRFIEQSGTEGKVLPVRIANEFDLLLWLEEMGERGVAVVSFDPTTERYQEPVAIRDLIEFVLWRRRQLVRHPAPHPSPA